LLGVLVEVELDFMVAGVQGAIFDPPDVLLDVRALGVREQEVPLDEGFILLGDLLLDGGLDLLLGDDRGAHGDLGGLLAFLDGHRF